MDLGPVGARSTPSTPPPFTAWVACPACGRYDCHLIRPPRPAPPADEMAAWDRDHLTEVVYRWGESDPVRTRTDPPRPVDESAYEVVRTCRCGHEWGMV